MNSANIIDGPYKLAKQHHAMRGTVALSDMERVSKLLVKSDGELEYRLSFALDADEVCVITGYIRGQLDMCCQRCLRAFCYDMQSEFIVSPVLSDSEAKLLSSEYEPVIMHDDRLDILALLEDELILALPQVPMHDVGDISCKPMLAVTNDREHAVQDMNNPFQILQEVKFKKNGQTAEDNQNGGTTES